MKNIYKISLLSIALFSFPSLLITKEVEGKKLNIAVYKIQPNNCPQSIGTAMEDIMITRLYSTSLFILMEKSQMDAIAQRNGFSSFDSTDNKQAAKLGKIFKVDKIIVGSVSKFGTYRLEIRAVDVKTGTVDITVPIEADDENELNAAITQAAHSVERHYLGYDRINGTFDFTVSPSILYPMGALGKDTVWGYGGNITASINNVLIDNVNILLLGGAFVLEPEKDKIKSLYLFPCEAGLSYKFALSPTLTFKPSLSGGVLYFISSIDKDGLMTNGVYEYETKNYIDPVIDVRFEFSFFVFNRWSMALTPSLLVMPEKNVSYIGKLDIGIKTVF